MDHELKQRLIGAVVVTALCAIFIPMLFDDPIDNSGQVVSELGIPEPANSGEGAAGKLPASTDEVLSQPDAEPLSAENTGDILESTGAEEEEEQPVESSGAEVVEEPQKPVKAAKPEVAQPKSTPKPVSTQKPVDTEAAEEVAKPVKPAKPEVAQPKAAPKQASAPKPVDTNVVEEGKEPVKAAKPEVAQPKSTPKPEDIQPKAAPKQMTAPKPVGADVVEEVSKPVKAAKPENIQPKPVSAGAPKPLDVAVEEAKKPVVAPKTEPSKSVPEMVRWYIQVGSFSQKENALSLWDKLHQQGFPVSLDTIPSEKGPTTYRLRIGPELDGKRAAAMKLKLDKQNIKAILLSE
ncbi:MAG: SPOR domain-containing protein [Methylobacter sp.]|jgi:DedD protein